MGRPSRSVKALSRRGSSRPSSAGQDPTPPGVRELTECSRLAPGPSSGENAAEACASYPVHLVRGLRTEHPLRPRSSAGDQAPTTLRIRGAGDAWKWVRERWAVQPSSPCSPCGRGRGGVTRAEQRARGEAGSARGSPGGSRWADAWRWWKGAQIWVYLKVKPVRQKAQGSWESERSTDDCRDEACKTATQEIRESPQMKRNKRTEADMAARDWRLPVRAHRLQAKANTELTGTSGKTPKERFGVKASGGFGSQVWGAVKPLLNQKVPRSNSERWQWRSSSEVRAGRLWTPQEQGQRARAKAGSRSQAACDGDVMWRFG